MLMYSKSSLFNQKTQEGRKENLLKKPTYRTNLQSYSNKETTH